MKIAVFCPNLIGDTVMATPTFRALRLRFPDAALIAVARPGVAPVLDGNPWFDDLILFDRHARDRARRTLAVIRQLRRENADIAVLLPNTFRSAWLAWAGGIPQRVGYDRYARGILLTTRLTESRVAGRRVPSPIVESYFKLAQALGCKADSLRIELFTTDADEACADRAFARLGLNGGQRVVCLNTGGAFGPAKSWPTGHFAALAQRLTDELGVSVLVVCGPDEREPAREIVRLAGRAGVVSLAEDALSLGLTKACVRRSALMITTDSGPRHFAAAFQVPVITLFGPTHMAWTRTNHPLAWHMAHPVPCGPCQKRFCPEGHHHCMRNLSSDSVFHVARRALQVNERSVPGQKERAE